MLCIFVFSNDCFAQNDFKFTTFTTKDGLSDNQLNSIYQDKKGFIWLGTPQGIDRYDGSTYKHFSPSQLANGNGSIDAATVYFESKPNHLICRIGFFEGYIFQTVEQKFTKIKSLKDKSCQDIERLDDKNIVVSLVDTALILDNELNLKITVIPPLESKSANVYVYKCDKEHWLVTSGREFFKYNIKNKSFTKILFDFKLEKTNNVGWKILHYDEHQKAIYASNYFHYLVKFDLNGKVIHEYTNVPGSATLCKPNPESTHILYFTGENGLTTLNTKTNSVIHRNYEKDAAGGLNAGYIFDFIFDHQGVFWAATLNGLLRKIQFSNGFDFWEIDPIHKSEIFSITVGNDKKVYCTSYYGKTNQFDSKTGVNKVLYPNSEEMNWFTIKNNDEIISGGAKRFDIHVFNTKTKKKRVDNSFKKYFPDADMIVLAFKHSNGDLWYSGNQKGGLLRIEKTSGKITHYNSNKENFKASYFTYCTEDEQGDLWLGSNKTHIVTHWKRAENRFEEIDFNTIGQKKKVITTGVNSMMADKKGNVWVGFNGNGLLKYSLQKKSFTILSMKEGLTSNTIKSLTMTSDHQIWIGTDRGLMVFNTRSNEMIVLNLKSGFIAESFNQNATYFDAESQTLWVGAEKYLIRLFPNKFKKKPHIGNYLFIDELLVNNKNRLIDGRKKYVFKSNENNVQIRFGLLDLNASNELEFSYKLRGSENKWVDLGNQKQINFANLPAGKHELTLRAKASGDSSWIQLSHPLEFEIKQVWFKQWWFVLLVILFIGAGTFFLIRSFYKRKLDQQKALIEKRIAVQHERDRIAYDMHDDLGSGLTKISYLSESILKKGNDDASLHKIQDTSLDLIKNMSEIIWALKVENDSLRQVQSYTKRYAYEYLESNNLELETRMVESDLLDEITVSGENRRSIFLIVKEALHNVVKHANSSKVEISTELNENYLILIRDNGIGFSSGNRENGNGISSMKRRAEKLGGTIKFSFDHGTHIEISLPVKGIET